MSRVEEVSVIVGGRRSGVVEGVIEAVVGQDVVVVELVRAMAVGVQWQWVVVGVEVAAPGAGGKNWRRRRGQMSVGHLVELSARVRA